MREADLFPVVKAWLEEQGFIALAEVPLFYRGAHCIDVVGYRLHRTVAIELKTGFTAPLARQLGQVILVTPWSYAAAPTKPSKTFHTTAHRIGFGILRLTDHVEVLHKPHISRHHSLIAYRQQQFIDRCTQLVAEDVHTHKTGGVPQLAGIGPAQDVARAVAQYRTTHPDATWEELYENIPNHYAHVRSMRGALRSRRLV